MQIRKRLYLINREVDDVFWSKQTRRVASVIIIIIIVAMTATTIIPYII